MVNKSQRIQIVIYLREGFGVEDISKKIDVNPRFIWTHIEALRKSGALYALYQQSRREARRGA